VTWYLGGDITNKLSPKLHEVSQSYHYLAVKLMYGDNVAERSQVPLINHINEGLIILEDIGASIEAMKAYCMHPLFQDTDKMLIDGVVFSTMYPVGALPLLYVMEYRRVANSCLPKHIKETRQGLMPLTIKLPDLTDTFPSVAQMLIADKVQNRKDFEIHHKETHKDSEVLDFYFKRWLGALGISEQRYQRLKGLIS